MLLVATPWYAAVTWRTDGAWLSGFFFIHNVGRFVAPMEKGEGLAAGISVSDLASLVDYLESLAHGGK